MERSSSYIEAMKRCFIFQKYSHTMLRYKVMAIVNVEWCDFMVFSNGSAIANCILADHDYWT